MILIGCEQCKSCVHHNPRSADEYIAEVIERLGLPCPRCGVIGSLTAETSRWASSEETASRRCEQLGWARTSPDGCGLFGQLGLVEQQVNSGGIANLPDVDRVGTLLSAEGRIARTLAAAAWWPTRMMQELFYGAPRIEKP